MDRDQYLAELEKIYREKGEAIVEGFTEKNKETMALLERYAEKQPFDEEGYKKESAALNEKYKEKARKMDEFYQSQEQTLQAKYQREHLKTTHGLERESDCVFLAAMNVFDIMREETREKEKSTDTKAVLDTFHAGGKEALEQWLQQKTAETLNESMQQLHMWRAIAKLIQDEYIHLKTAVDSEEPFTIYSKKKEKKVIN